MQIKQRPGLGAQISSQPERRFFPLPFLSSVFFKRRRATIEGRLYGKLAAAAAAIVSQAHKGCERAPTFPLSNSQHHHRHHHRHLRVNSNNCSTGNLVRAEDDCEFCLPFFRHFSTPRDEQRTLCSNLLRALSSLYSFPIRHTHALC